MRRLHSSPRAVLGWAFLFLAGTSAVQAAAHFRASSKIDNRSGPRTFEVEGWAEGEKAHLDVRASDNPIAHAGTFLLTTDGAQTVKLVDPPKKTFGTWNVEAMMGLTEGVTETMGPLLTITLAHPQIENEPEIEGGLVAGVRTRLYRTRVRYTSHVRVLGVDRAAVVTIEQSTWRTDKLKDAGLRIWLRASAPKTGDAHLDEMLSQGSARLPGLPLKIATKITSTADGTDHVSMRTMEVTELGSAEVAPSIFGIPDGFTETQIAPGSENQGTKGE
jgi:hypothetical protein